MTNLDTDVITNHQISTTYNIEVIKLSLHRECCVTTAAKHRTAFYPPDISGLF